MSTRQRTVMTLSVPPLMAAEYRQLAREKGESASELFREMFAFYRENKLKGELYELHEHGSGKVREPGISEKVADRPDLSVAERVLLVEEIWDSIARVPEQVLLSKAQAQELDIRLDTHHRNPDEGTPWPTVLERIRSRV